MKGKGNYKCRISYLDKMAKGVIAELVREEWVLVRKWQKDYSILQPEATAAVNEAE